MLWHFDRFVVIVAGIMAHSYPVGELMEQAYEATKHLKENTPANKEELQARLVDIDAQILKFRKQGQLELEPDDNDNFQRRVKLYQNDIRAEVIDDWNSKFDDKHCQQHRCNSTDAAQKYVNPPGAESIKYLCFKHCMLENGISCGIPDCNNVAHFGQWGTFVFQNKIIRPCQDCLNDRDRFDVDCENETIAFKQNEESKSNDDDGEDKAINSLVVSMIAKYPERFEQLIMENNK